MSESDLAIDADAIIQGKVTSTWSEWGENARYIYTYGTVTVDRMIKGNVPGKEYLVRTPGGSIGEATMEVPGAPQFKLVTSSSSSCLMTSPLMRATCSAGSRAVQCQ